MNEINLIMYCATGLIMCNKVVEIGATYKNKNANMNNLPERILSLIANCLGMIFAVYTQNNPIFINYTCISFLDSVSLIVRSYYASYNKFEPSPSIHLKQQNVEDDNEEIV